MIVLIEVIIATLFSVLPLTEEVENQGSENICSQEQIVGEHLSEECE